LSDLTALYITMNKMSQKWVDFQNHHLLSSSGGAGLNTIDAATNNSFLPLIGVTPYEVPVYGPLKLHVTGNNVNGAKFRIVFSFVPM